MAATNEDICNSALAKLGAEEITSLSDNTRRAKLCNRQFTKIRDRLLRSHPWNFAIKRASLTANGNTPAFEYEQEFDLPADYLRGVREEYKDTDWKIEGQKLLANQETINLVYIAQITDPTEFDPSFDELLATQLAYELAYPMVQSSSLKQLMKEELDELKRDVRSFDAQEGFPEELEANEFLIARQ